jgi:hypothetical protein
MIKDSIHILNLELRVRVASTFRCSFFWYFPNSSPLKQKRRYLMIERLRLKVVQQAMERAMLASLCDTQDTLILIKKKYP